MQQAVRVLSLLAGFAIATGPSSGEAIAQEKISFAGKSVTMTIGNAAGGATDIYGRLIGRHLMARLPGNPGLLVVNQPGAGGVTSLNSWTVRAPTDGLAVTIGASSQTDPAALAQTKAKFNPKDLKLVGGKVGHSQVLFVREDAAVRLSDKSLPPVIIGTVSGTLRGGNFQALWGRAFLGWNLRWVQGYPDSAQIRQALERGEIDMMSVGSDADIDYILALKKFKVVSQTGVMHNGKPLGRADMRDVPIFETLVTGKITDPLAQRALDYWNNMRQVGNWLALPPNTPSPIHAIYVQAFNEMAKDKTYIADLERFDPGSPTVLSSELESLIEQLSRTDADVLEFVQAEQERQGVGGR